MSRLTQIGWADHKAALICLNRFIGESYQR
jgi:hypothetical protein